MFTFATITYNHSRFILEHLESIKYQIENYAEDIKVNLVICDDSSSDNTVELIEKWISVNCTLFNSCIVEVNDSNMGTISNYLKAISLVSSDKYKLLAGDDIYYKNNIFNAIDNYDFVATPTIEFSVNEIKIPLNDYDYFIKNKNIVRERLKYGNVFQAPGIFINPKVTKDRGLACFLSNYKWIEDFPSWHYIFFKYKEPFKYRTLKTPYIMYRKDVGIFGNTVAHEKGSYFLDEENKMNSDLLIDENIKKYKVIKYFTVSNYKWRIHLLLKKWFNSISIPLVSDKEVSDYYNLIQRRSRAFSEINIT